MNFIYPNLKVSDIKFKEFFDYIPSPIYVWKKIEDELILIYYNRATENITNFKIKQFLGGIAKEIYKDKPQIIEDLYQCINKKLNFSREMSYKLISVDKEKHFYFTYNYIPPDLIFVHTEDITKQKKAEDNLKKSEGKYRELFNNMGSCVAVYEAIDNGNDFLFKDFNLAAEKVDNVKRKDIVGKSIVNIFPGVNEYGLFEIIKRVWKTGIPEHHPISYYKDERIHGWRENYVYKLPTGEIIDVYEDVTKNKLADHQLKISEEKYRLAYNRTNLYKDIFTHDINNILQIILSSLELTKIFSQDPNKKNEFEKVTSLINQEVIRCKNLVLNVQKMSDVEESKISLRSIESLNLLHQTIDLLKKDYPFKNIIIGIEASQKEYYVYANELLKSVFENIFFNSLTHNRNPVIEISVTTSNEKKEKIDYIKFEFKDNAMGIPDSKKENIFLRDYKKKESSSGIGLGLLLVKRILESYKGQIKVEDRIRGDYSKGSNFIILIPKAV
ncbi:hypothetical protein LCGC14_0733670 [marine sediment metagenome]|uniref:Histidine kinase domain-containing protein n=1 Tax=marine sediment metagenome TaxID=412755 RepID=A0A0F9TG45_9ZZZZ